MTVKLFIASTLDGYIATKEESLQWLFDVEGEGDNGYGAFYSDIGTIIMGKKTYDWLEKEQAGQWPYSDKTSYILTHQKISSTDNIVFIDKEKLTELSVNPEAQEVADNTAISEIINRLSDKEVLKYKGKSISSDDIICYIAGGDK